VRIERHKRELRSTVPEKLMKLMKQSMYGEKALVYYHCYSGQQAAGNAQKVNEKIK